MKLYKKSEGVRNYRTPSDLQIKIIKKTNSITTELSFREIQVEKLFAERKLHIENLLEKYKCKT